MPEIEIEIDGKKLTAQSDQTIIQVADAAGVYIPRFCYHKHLSIAANCRMCLVEVEKSPKPLPACATPVMPGMKVFTRSQKTIEAQRAVMEFLLINHPLDCPICDQGGECELQDLSMGYGSSHSDYDECKRAVPDLNLGPLIATEMTRCIHCTRCVRFGDEIAGMRELGATFRGGETEISTYVQHAMKSEVSGNIIDLCPVGALTSKPYRFTARAWELDQFPTISPHDSLGSNLFVHTRYGEVKRVVSRENQNINETWISDRDRFSYTALYHEDRITHPMIRINNEWKQIEWQQALEIVVEGLKNSIKEFGANQIGALANPSSTCEEFYLLQKIMRALGSNNVDYRLREIDTRDQLSFEAVPNFPSSANEIEQSDAIFLIGSNLQKELPLIATRVRKAITKGAEVSALNPIDYHFNFVVKNKFIVSPTEMATALAQLIECIKQSSDQNTDQIEKNNLHTFAADLRNKKSICIIVGALALHHQYAARIRELAKQLSTLLNAKLNIITDGANSAGGWLAGCVPHRHSNGSVANEVGMSAYEMLHQPRKAYVLLNVEPEFDTANAQLAIDAMQQSNFIVALSIYKNPILEKYAQVILPMAPFTETSGSYVNCFGEWQSFKGVAKAYGASRPAWKILRVLGNFLNLDGFEYENSESIKRELKSLVESHKDINGKNSDTKITCSDSQSSAEQPSNMLERVGEIPIYAIDSLVRRALPLQDAQKLMEGNFEVIRLNPLTAERLKLTNEQYIFVKQANQQTQLVVQVDDRIAPNTAWIPGGTNTSVKLGDLFGNVEIKTNE